MPVECRYEPIDIHTAYPPEGGALQVFNVIWVFFVKLGEEAAPIGL